MSSSKKTILYETDAAGGKLPPGAVDGMAAEIDEFDRNGSPHDYILGEEDPPYLADDADEAKRKAGLVPDPDNSEV
jgi:hypothetical protein